MPQGIEQAQQRQGQHQQQTLIFGQTECPKDQAEQQGFPGAAWGMQRMPRQPPQQHAHHQEKRTVGQKQQTATGQQQRREAAEGSRDPGGSGAEPAAGRRGQQRQGGGVAEQARQAQGQHRFKPKDGWQTLPQTGPERHGRGMVEVTQSRMLPVEEVIALVVSRRQDERQQPTQHEARKQNQRRCTVHTRNVSRTERSSRVEVSPLTSWPAARARRMRRMILPLRVLGRASVNLITSGRAIGPISLPT